MVDALAGLLHRRARNAGVAELLLDCELILLEVQSQRWASSVSWFASRPSSEA
jgi:hypothetical protein